MRRLAKRVARQEVQERFNLNVCNLMPIEMLFHTGHGKLWNRHIAHSESVLSSEQCSRCGLRANVAIFTIDKVTFVFSKNHINKTYWKCCVCVIPLFIISWEYD